eukprot:12407491-Karenia_brevis.AAC.1
MESAKSAGSRAGNAFIQKWIGLGSQQTEIIVPDVNWRSAVTMSPKAICMMGAQRAWSMPLSIG